MNVLEYLLFPPGPPGPVFERWGPALLAAYVTLALALVLFDRVTLTINARNGLNRWLVRRILLIGGGLQLAGVTLLLLRLANWPLLSMRLWLYAQLALEVAAALYLLWWLRERYPDRQAAYEWEEKKRAYIPRAAGGTFEPPRRRAAARRK